MQVSGQRPEARGEGLYEAFAAALDALIPDPRPLTSPLAVALSGGADSMALTLLARDYVAARGGTLVALTVDHRLRPESTAEAAQVAALMQAQGIPHHILTPTQVEAGNNLQQRARQWRYDALTAWCRAQRVVHCLLAHQAGDNRETVAMQQARGDTADGESGMARTRNHGGVRFLRPLLMMERAELEDFLRSIPMGWIEDPSNRNPHFARVRMRAALADDPAAVAACTAQIARGAAERRARDAALAEAALQCVRLMPTGEAMLDVAHWQGLAPWLRSQLLADLLTTIDGSAYRPRAHETATLAEAMLQQILHRSKKMLRRTLHRCEIEVEGERATIRRELARVEGPRTLIGGGECIWDRRFRVRYTLPKGEALVLRAWGRGEGDTRTTRAISPATPSFWRGDVPVYIPYHDATPPEGFVLTIGFAPAKPLAPAPFW